MFIGTVALVVFGACDTGRTPPPPRCRSSQHMRRPTRTARVQLQRANAGAQRVNHKR